VKHTTKGQNMLGDTDSGNSDTKWVGGGGGGFLWSPPRTHKNVFFWVKKGPTLTPLRTFLSPKETSWGDPFVGFCPPPPQRETPVPIISLCLAHTTRRDGVYHGKPQSLGRIPVTTGWKGLKGQLLSMYFGWGVRVCWGGCPENWKDCRNLEVPRVNPLDVTGRDWWGKVGPQGSTLSVTVSTCNHT